jgi:putative ABC transport system permease protein
MEIIRVLFSRCAALFGKRKRDKDLDEELRSHIDFAVEEKRRRGMSAEMARTAALKEFGGVTQTKESYREQRGLPFLEVLAQDIRYASRQQRKSPGFTATAVITLALGIGANSAVFSVVDGVLLRPLPYEDPDRLVWIHDGLTQQDKGGWSACMEDFLLWRDGSRSFEHLAAFHGDQFTLTGDGHAERVAGADVSADFFETLGVKPLLGQTFAGNADQPGEQRTAVISERLWRDRYAARADVLNKSVVIDGHPVAIVGVMPSNFQFRLPDAEIWEILSLAPPTRRGPFILRGVARLKRGVSLDQVNAEMANLARQVERADPKGTEHLRYPVEPLREVIVGDMRPLLAALTGAVALVLLISIFNVANLMLARSMARQQEIAVRLGIGAGRRRLVQQLLTESIMLALAGGAAGAVLAVLGNRLLHTLAPAGIPRLDAIGIDGRVLAFTFLVSVLSGVVFGLVPALGATRTNLTISLREGGRGGTESRGYRTLRSALVVIEMALSVILLAGAGLLIRSFMSLSDVRAGFDASAHQLLTMQISPSSEKYEQPYRLSSYWNQIIERVNKLPGVELSALAVWLPPDHSAMSDSFEIQDRTPPDGGPVVPVPIVSEDYFKTLQVPLLRGRYFDSRDTMTSPRVTIISQNLARRYFPGEDPIGRRLKHGGPNSDNPSMEIVGVVGDVKYEGAAVPDEPVYYEASSQEPNRPMWLVVRTHGDAHVSISAVRSTISDLDADVPVSHVGSMSEAIVDSVALPRFRSLLMGTIACVALLLAAVGIYGVMAYSVAQRTQEMAIRMALGATKGNVTWLLVGNGALLALSGIGMGLIGAIAFVRILKTMLFGVSAGDPFTFGAAALLLMFVALMACYIPARRARRINPMQALRTE